MFVKEFRSATTDTMISSLDAFALFFPGLLTLSICNKNSICFLCIAKMFSFIQQEKLLHFQAMPEKELFFLLFFRNIETVKEKNTFSKTVAAFLKKTKETKHEGPDFR